MIEKMITRRSIRKYTGQEVSNDQINQILKVAMYAPSASNQQAWQFVVLDDHKIMDEIPKVHQGAEIIKGASKAILICADEKAAKSKDYLANDCALTTLNILHAVHAIGLGGCWIAIYPREPRIEKLKELCNLPEGIMPFAVVAIGYPAEEIETEDRFKKEKIHYNTW